jgi:hypothetical protein
MSFGVEGTFAASVGASEVLPVVALDAFLIGAPEDREHRVVSLSEDQNPETTVAERDPRCTHAASMLYIIDCFTYIYLHDRETAPDSCTTRSPGPRPPAWLPW